MYYDLAALILLLVHIFCHQLFLMMLAMTTYITFVLTYSMLTYISPYCGSSVHLSVLTNSPFSQVCLCIQLCVNGFLLFEKLYVQAVQEPGRPYFERRFIHTLLIEDSCPGGTIGESLQSLQQASIGPLLTVAELSYAIQERCASSQTMSSVVLC